MRRKADAARRGSGHARVCRRLLTARACAELRTPTGETPLLAAMRHGDPRSIALILAARAAVDRKSGPLHIAPLRVAIERGHLAAVPFLP